MNNVNVIGRTCKAPELRYTNGANKAVCSVTLAVDDGWGENKRTFWIPCTAWEKKAEAMAKLEKGQQVGISGKITSREWEKDGQKRTVVEVLVNEITFVGSKKSEGAPVCQSEVYEPLPEDDDLPF